MAKCVVQEWVWELPLMQQTVLLSAIRGADGLSKENPSKILNRELRKIILLDATQGRGTFMSKKLPLFDWRVWIDNFTSNMDNMPLHFVLHLAHAAEIIGYHHPDSKVRKRWIFLYSEICRTFHMSPEDEFTMDLRLNK